MLDALRDFRRIWPQLLIIDLVSRALRLVLVAPLISLLLWLFLVRTDDRVLTDTDIARFALHPLGLLALLLLASVTLWLFLARLSLHMVVGFGAAEDRRVTYLDAYAYTLRRSLPLAHAGARVVLRAVVIAAPFLAAIGVAAFLLLRAHDINYYLAVKPPELWAAVLCSAILVAILGFLLLRLVATWFLVAPLLLFSRATAREAIRESERLTSGARPRVILVLVTWLASVSLLAAGASYLVGLAGELLVPDLHGDLTALALNLVVAFSLAFLTSLCIDFVGDALLPLLMVRFFRQVAGPGALLPAIAEPGTLGRVASFRIPGKAWLCAALVAVALVLATVYAASRSFGSEGTVEIIAHRGASAAAPENTLAAFRRAIAEGATWIEIDVQESADGQVIVAHDSDFMKQARRALKVWDATQADLRDLDIGSWFDPAFAGERVPSLREVLELAQGNVGVVIELKYYGHDQDLEARVARIVEDAGSQSEVMVMSLDRAGLRRMAALRPGWTRGLLNTVSVGDLTRIDVDFLALNAAAATRSQIRRAHERGLKVYAWTINDPLQMSVLLSRGVDGIITDEPALAHRALQLRRDLSPLGQLLVWMASEIGLIEGADASSDAADM